MLSRKFKQIRFIQISIRKISLDEAREVFKESLPNATTQSAADIKKAYLKLAKIYHPDSATGSTTKFQKV